MSRKLFLIYTKSFGGKIGNFLHSVSPDNIFGKKFKNRLLHNFSAKNIQTPSRARKLKSEMCQFPSTLQNALTKDRFRVFKTRMLNLELNISLPKCFVFNVLARCGVYF